MTHSASGHPGPGHPAPPPRCTASWPRIPPPGRKAFPHQKGQAGALGGLRNRQEDGARRGLRSSPAGFPGFPALPCGLRTSARETEPKIIDVDHPKENTGTPCSSCQESLASEAPSARMSRCGFEVTNRVGTRTSSYQLAKDDVVQKGRWCMCNRHFLHLSDFVQATCFTISASAFAPTEHVIFS